MKFNPFKPNSIVTPGMFSGRAHELRAIEQCLYQAKHGNPQHFLLEGERGIGKSSLLLFVHQLANGTIPNSESQRFNFLTVPADLAQCETMPDIIKEVGRALEMQLAESNQLLEKLKKTWDFLTKFEIFGLKFNGTSQDIAEGRLLAELVTTISTLVEHSSDHLDGVIILIDEADRPPEAANLGLFLKLLTERLTRKNCHRCLIGMAGLPTLIPKLRASHDSSPRVFEAFLLEPLEVRERCEVIEKGLEEANRRNTSKTGATPDALDLIAHLSEGYPHFIQQFSYSAFEWDADGLIDSTDVVESAFAENGALSQLGHKYFNKMYFEQINSDNYRIVLKAMAKYGSAWVSRVDLIRSSGVGEHVVDNALRALRERDIIHQDETRRGFYRLPTQSFAAWINALNSVEEKKGAEAQL